MAVAASGVGEGSDDETNNSKFAKRTWNVLWNQRDRKMGWGKEPIKSAFRLSMLGLKAIHRQQVTLQRLNFGEVRLLVSCCRNKAYMLPTAVSSMFRSLCRCGRVRH